jgi:hypothetical protein
MNLDAADTTGLIIEIYANNFKPEYENIIIEYGKKHTQYMDNSVKYQYERLIQYQFT